MEDPIQTEIAKTKDMLGELGISLDPDPAVGREVITFEERHKGPP